MKNLILQIILLAVFNFPLFIPKERKALYKWYKGIIVYRLTDEIAFEKKNGKKLKYVRRTNR
jgi:hypothetical protein